MVKNQYQYHLPENFHRPKFPYKWSALLLVSRAECFKRKFVFCLFKPTELVCAHGKRDPGIKFTGLEFCLPFTQTVNWPVFPCKWLWEMVNNLYFRMKQKRRWNLLTSVTDILFNILLNGQFAIHLYRSVSWEFYLLCQTHKMIKKAPGKGFGGPPL